MGSALDGVTRTANGFVRRGRHGSTARTAVDRPVRPDRAARPHGPPAIAEGGPPSTAPAPVSARPPADALALAPERVPELPGAEDPVIRGLWVRAVSLESELRFEEAASAYAELAPHVPSSASPHWRTARAYWRLGDGTAADDTDAKVDAYGRALEWSQSGMAIDANCAECMLWQYAALGRLTMAEGIMSGLRRARTMSRMLDRAIELQPGYSDNAYNSTLGNLYYARAIWNRMVPEWWFLPIVAGVKGDKDRALEDIERAVALHPDRIDYRVEKGAVLLCLGTDRGEAARLDAGRLVLREAMRLERKLESDPADIALARALLREPEKACGYSRAGFVDLDDVKGRL